MKFICLGYQDEPCRENKSADDRQHFMNKRLAYDEENNASFANRGETFNCLNHSQSITIIRIVSAAPAEVFGAWIDKEHLRQWWGPRSGQIDWTTPSVALVPEPGGVFQTCIRSPSGDEYRARGSFQEIEMPERIVFTHGWENQSGEVEQQRVVTVQFTPSEEMTRLSFHISGYESVASRDSEIEGWTECLDRLVKRFRHGPETP